MIDLTRSYERIQHDDLQRLGQIAKRDGESFFARNPKYAPLQNYVLAVALCQGAALHFVDGRNGIKDLDVWTFYADVPGLQYPPRRPVACYDFGNDKFGRTRDFEHFTGRKVDCLGRSLEAQLGTPATVALRQYLEAARTRSAGELAGKAVVLIEPLESLGTIVWPINAQPSV